MKYSFTKPLPKSIVSRSTKIWICLFLLSIIIIYTYGIYLNSKIDTLNAARQTIESNIDSKNKDISRLKYELSLNSINESYNKGLKSAVLKLFALIPDQVTITYMSLEEKSLVLKGTTPTQQVYSFYLGTPLKTIFDKSNVDFIPLTNGWFNFTSISTLGDDSSKARK